MLTLALAALIGGSSPGHSVELRAVGARKIEVIKLVREVTGLGLKEAKDLVEAAPKVVKVGLELTDAQEIAAKLRAAGATAEVVGGGPAPRTVAARASSVTLISFGASKIQVIKLVRDATGLGLKETKELVERAPTVVKVGLSVADAEALVAQLQRAGATAKVGSDAL